MTTRTYIANNGDPITESLPEGRYLKADEILRQGDLYCRHDQPKLKTGYAGGLAMDNEFGRYYRPERKL